MVCVLLNTNDSSGAWLFRSLQQKGVKDIRLISIDELLYASRFKCGLQNGKAFFNIQLSNGLDLTDQNVTTVLNRIQHLPAQYTNRFTPQDQDYVNQEMKAIFVFLFSIMPNQLFNTTSGMGMNGRSRSQLEWMQLAHKAGFKTSQLVYENKLLHNPDKYPPEKNKTILFFNGKCFAGSAIDYRLSELCLKLGNLSNERIIEIYVQQATSNTFVFTGVATIPTFNGAGDDFLTELTTLL